VTDEAVRGIVTSLVEAIQAGTTVQRRDAVKAAQWWLDGGEARPTHGQVMEAFDEWAETAALAVVRYRRWRYLQAGLYAGAAIAISDREIQMWEAHETIARLLADELFGARGPDRVERGQL